MLAGRLSSLIIFTRGKPDDMAIKKGGKCVVLERPAIYSIQDGCCGSDCVGGGGCSSGTKEIGRKEVESHLCYSCSLVASKMPEMPGFVVDEAARRSRRKVAKGEIEDFFL
jgi:hypothetical protein